VSSTADLARAHGGGNPGDAVTAKRPRTLMTVVALIMGLMAGLLIALIVELVRANPVWSDPPATSTLVLALLIGWAFATWLLLRRAGGVLRVMQRGFLVGIVEWVMMGLIMTLFGSRIVPPPGTEPIERASWEPVARQFEGAIADSMVGSVATAFAFVCLVGWGMAFIAERSHERSVARDEEFLRRAATARQ
jgi:hypothetical protein